jgi:transcriptional regulator with XRE-family HTH domain
MEETKGRRANELQETGDRMATNLAEIRRTKRLTTGALSERLTALGRPILPTGITKIEKGARRVDVDDLVALALALGVTPNRLLLPDTVPESLLPPGERPAGDVTLTPEVSVTAQAAWRWASGEAPLPVRMPWDDQNADSAQYREFQRVNRPHDSAQVNFDQLLALRAKLSEVWGQVRAVSDAEGVPIATIANFLLLMRDWERVESRTEEA